MIISLDDERKKTRTTVSRQQAGSYWRQDDRRSELGSTSFGPQRAHRGAPVAPDVNRSVEGTKAKDPAAKKLTDFSTVGPFLLLLFFLFAPFVDHSSNHP